MSVDYLPPIERDIHDQVQTLQSGLIAPRFTSNGRSFFWRFPRGGLLQLLTAGFYRFWFLTNIRRSCGRQRPSMATRSNTRV